MRVRIPRSLWIAQTRRLSLLWIILFAIMGTLKFVGFIPPYRKKSEPLDEHHEPEMSLLGLEAYMARAGRARKRWTQRDFTGPPDGGPAGQRSLMEKLRTVNPGNHVAQRAPNRLGELRMQVRILSLSLDCWTCSVIPDPKVQCA